MVLEFQLTSNVRLNNIIDLKKHPLKTYLEKDISCVMGTDGCGLYGTDSIDEQIALTNLLKITDEEFLKMKTAEDAIITRQKENFIRKEADFKKAISGRTVHQYYMEEFQKEFDDISGVEFEIHKFPSYPVFKEKIVELPWNKYPIVIAGGSFNSGNGTVRVPDSDKLLIQTLLDHLDPDKVFFVIGHKLLGHEKYLVDNNRGFDVYSIVPALMEQAQIKKLSRANIKGIRVSTEAQEMGIYKSFNYEIFERRNSTLFAFEGNSSIANLVQEARNGKGRTRVYIYPKSAMLKAKAISLEGYVTMNAPVIEVIKKIREMEDNIGTKVE